MIDVFDSFYRQLSFENGIALFKRQQFSCPCTTDQMGKRHKDSVSANPSGCTDLILAESQFPFALAEKDLDRPAFHIRPQYLFRIQRRVGTDKCTHCFCTVKCFPRITDQNDCVFNSIQTALVTVNVVLAFSSCHTENKMAQEPPTVRLQCHIRSGSLSGICHTSQLHNEGRSHYRKA